MSWENDQIFEIVQFKKLKTFQNNESRTIRFFDF